MFPTASGAVGGFPVKAGTTGGGSLELGAVVYLASASQRIQPYLGLTAGFGGFTWVYTEEVYEDEAFEDLPSSIDMLYFAPQIGADWGLLSIGARFLLTRHGLDTLPDFEEYYGGSHYLEIYVALAARDLSMR